MIKCVGGTAAHNGMASPIYMCLNSKLDKCTRVSANGNIMNTLHCEFVRNPVVGTSTCLHNWTYAKRTLKISAGFRELEKYRWIYSIGKHSYNSGHQIKRNS